jgi:pimeloyl-ACP methyl ester carboxylesterase
VTAEAILNRTVVGDAEAAREIAMLRREGGKPALFWLGGFRSDMAGSKATAIDAYARAHGLAATRFDYSGHGQSSGRFEDGTVSRWLEEARHVFETIPGRQIIIGSSMGGWIALLLAEALRESDRVAGLLLVAPATDMTRTLMWDTWSKSAQRTLMSTGVYLRPSEYGGEPYPITRQLIEDGNKHLFGERLIEVGCPVHVLQGMEDKDVPWRHAQRLITQLASDDAVLTLVKDGDHRLSRPEDIGRLNAAIDGLIAQL